MNKPHFALFDVMTDPPAGGGGGGGGGDGGAKPYDFRPSLPEDIRADPLWDTLKPKDDKEFLQLVTKGYVHAQKMVGTNRLPVPQKDWKPEQWASFNKALGVPDKADGYTTPEVKLHEGLEINAEQLGVYKKLFHELGLRPDQAAKLQEFYFNDISTKYGAEQSAKKTAQADAMRTLTEEYGDQTQGKLELAQSVVKKFGSEELVKAMSDSGFGNNPAFVKMMVTLGESLMDDHAGGGGDGLPVGTRAAAVQEIEKLKIDKDFQAAMNDRQNPGHAAAVKKWLDLHTAAAGGVKSTA